MSEYDWIEEVARFHDGQEAGRRLVCAYCGMPAVLGLRGYKMRCPCRVERDES